MKENELTSYYITRSIFKCFIKPCSHTGATVHSAVTYMYFKMFNSDAANSSVSFSTLPETSGREPEFDFSPKRMPALTGWSREKLKLFGTQVRACSGQRPESSVLRWELLRIAGAWHLPSLKQLSKKSCLASSRLNDAWCLSSLLAARLLSSSLFEPGMAMDGRNCSQTV